MDTRVKNLHPTSLPLILALRLALDWLAAATFLFSGKGRHAWAVLKAHIYLLYHGYSLLKKRHHLAATLPHYAVDQVYEKSIVVEYFVLRNKKFTALKRISNPR